MKSYDELLAERDALAAQVESHSDVLKALLKTVPWFGVDGSLQADGQFYYKVAESVFKKAESTLSKTPQECLAEIRAEAGRAGFIECATHWCICDAFGEFVPQQQIEAAAIEYAAKLQKGGES